MTRGTLAARRAVLPAAIAGLALAAFLSNGCKKATTQTLDPGEEALVTFLESDYSTNDLLRNPDLGLAGCTEADLSAALETELFAALAGLEPPVVIASCEVGGAPGACFPFTLHDAHWIGARINSGGSLTVEGVSEGEPRNYLAICFDSEVPPPAAGCRPLLVENDNDPVACLETKTCVADRTACDPLIQFPTESEWICWFTVSPLCETSSPGCGTCFDSDEPTGGDLRIVVD